MQAARAARILGTCCQWSQHSYRKPCRQHKRPQAPAALRIYEAHVGMSSEEPSVATYTYFKGDTPVLALKGLDPPRGSRPVP